ncbi:hypothetical protein [Streptomyces sp. NPDC002044]|uniref:hypothetical protein n=1 Tax=Streptomyces sp. NPDC002044 TaxID=3154662 RepID=UPI0033202AF6
MSEGQAESRPQGGASSPWSWPQTAAPALPPGTHRAEAGQSVVRAALVHALELPAAAFRRLGGRPEPVTTLTGREGRWNLPLGREREQT